MMKIILSFLFLMASFFSVAAQSIAKDHIIGGNQLYSKKDYAKAELQYRQALSKDANSIKGNYNLGNALYQQGKLAEARTHYQKVLENPQATKEDKEKAYYNLGKTYLDERKFDDAEYHFKEALKLNPNDENARTNYNLAKKEIHPEDVGSEGNQENKQPNPNGDEKMEKPSDSDDSNASQKKEENKGSQKDDGENGNEDGKGNLPREQEIIKGSEGKGEDAPQAKSNEYHEGVLRALEQQEQETLKKIISQKAKKIRTNTEKDW